MTDREYMSLTLAVEMVRKSGVREWNDPQLRADLANAAVEMAGILSEQDDDEMANKVYMITETSIVFGSEVGDDVAWSTESIASGAGRQSAFHDRGADGTARAFVYRYRFYTQAQATPTVGNACRLYNKTSDGTHPDNDDGTSDAAVSAEDKLKNLTPLRGAIVDEAAANIEYVSKGRIAIAERYFGPVLWNAMGSTITADAAETKAVFTPIVHEVQ